MKTDSIFYNLFQAFPSIFFELINRSPEEAASYEFTSREVKQLAFRLDGLFLPKTNAPDKPFYLVEVQFQPDASLYYRVFAELFLFLKQYQPPHPWQIVIIYPNRPTEREQPLHFGNLLALNQVRRIYLDELGEAAERSLGVGVVKLVIEPEETAGQLARHLIEQAQQQLRDELVQRDLINLIETIIVYKLPQKSREEIAAMLGLSELKKTRFYQEVFEEGKQEGKQEAKLETVLALLQLGLTSAQIAEALKLPLELVQQTAQQTTRKAMSFYEQNVAAFIELLTRQRSLFTPEYLAELEQVVAPLPDDIEELAKAIAEWCEEHPEVDEAQLRLLPNNSGEKAPGSKEGKVKTPNYELNKQTLQNAIQQSSSSSDSQSSNSGS
ncbi:MAG: Rpn family recombination-promoting nuclease/putative transposase [Coleofasciculus sp. C1-SOL-03]|uniref:Rpn family recombination-promoting nuclease/putative transposase n=1 Tax=Coleofasciculus sp. C1-SOL-03 TaxID=3069522 RepID=UPI00330081F6